MKPYLREILTDLKAAARIGHPDTIREALDGIRALSAEQFPPSNLQPFGAALSGVRKEVLLPMGSDPDPAVRGIAAVALARGYVLGKRVAPEDLRSPAVDRSPEVRAALIQSLLETREEAASPEKLAELAESWTRSKSKLRVQAGVMLLPSCGFPASKVLELLAPLQHEADYGIRAALVDALNRLAGETAAGAVIGLLERWVGEDEPNSWVITRVLSAGWSLDWSPQARKILEMLGERAGKTRAVSRALKRHA